MKKFALILFAILSLCVPAMAQTIGTATITAQGNFTVPAGGVLSLNVQLIGCNSTTPLYNSFPISITPNQTPGAPFVANGSGSVTFTVPGNDAVICGGQNYTRYALTWKINGLPIAPTQSYRFLEGQNQVLSAITPVEFVPPIISNGFSLQCPSGQILTGYNTQYVPQCVAIPVGSLTNTLPLLSVTGNFNSVNSTVKFPRPDIRYSDFAVGTYILGATIVGGSGCSGSLASFSAPPNVGTIGVQATGTVTLSGGVPQTIHMNNMGAGYTSATASISGCSVAPTVTPILATCNSNIADGTGVNESTCAIQQDIDYAIQSFPTTSHPNPAPSVYIPAGTYTVGTSQALRAPCGLTIIGDGANTTTLNVPANSTNNGLTIYGPIITANATPLSQVIWECTGGMENIGIIGGGHTSTGNALELHGAIGYKVLNGRFENFGGRCVQLTGQNERVHFIGTLALNACRRSFIMGGENDKTVVDFMLLNSPGITNDGYSFNVNAVGGVFPSSGVLVPDRNCAVEFGSYSTAIRGGMIETPTGQCAIQIQDTASSQEISGLYIEGGVNGSLNSSIQITGRMQQTVATGPVAVDQYGTYLPTTANTFTTPNWMTSYVNDPQDIASAHGNGRAAMITCPDFAWGSVTPCAANAAIQQGQYEVVFGTQAGNNRFYLDIRNSSDILWSSTAPANSVWPTGSVIQELPAGTSVGGTKIRDVLLQSVNGASGVYSSGCSDSTSLLACGEIINGPVIEGNWFLPPTPGHLGPNAFGLTGTLDLDNTVQFASANETVGSVNWIKNGGRLSLYVDQFEPTIPGEYGANLASGTSLSNALPAKVSPITYAGVTTAPPLTIQALSGTTAFTDSSQYVNSIFDFFDPVVGRNRTGVGNSSQTTQYAGSLCNTDTPVGGISAATSIASTTTVVTVQAPNTFQPNEWVTFGVISGSTSTTVNFTSTLGLLLNGTSAQITSASATQYTFNFSNAGFGSTSDVGTAAPHSQIQVCSVGGPTIGTTFDFEMNSWTGTVWTLGPIFSVNQSTGLWTLTMPVTSNTVLSAATVNGLTSLSNMGQTGANAFAGKCTMAAGTSCTATLGHTYNTPVCIATQQATTLTGASTGCTVAGTTVTVTSSIANSEVWGFMVIGDPN